jgi:hypothetical protein
MSEGGFIRPSSLQIAEDCSRAPWLANRYREQNAAMRYGSDVDADVSTALAGGGEPQTKPGAELIAWVRRRFSSQAQYVIQRKVRLLDPSTGERITEGTPDLLVLTGQRLTVVDWKSRGQLYGGKLAMPAENMQQQAYGVAAAMEFGADEIQVILACFDDHGITPIEGEVIAAADWWPLIDRIKNVPPVDFDGPEPPATKGEHCDRCYQKLHCSAYLLPAMGGLPTQLVPFSEARTAALTLEDARAGLEWVEQADQAILRAKKVRDLVVKQLQTLTVTAGPIRLGDLEWGPIPTAGKRSGLSVADLEELGLTNLIKPATPGVKFDWKKIA